MGLWTMQSTAAAPAAFPLLYRELLDDARRVERLGFHSLWVGEHRLWYDGWCPAPLVALAAVAGATTRLRLGTAMLLLPQHDWRRVAATAAALHGRSGGRLELGLGLGYRDEEFDGLGLRRRDRGRRMEAQLDGLLGAWGQAPAAPSPAPGDPAPGTSPPLAGHPAPAGTARSTSPPLAGHPAPAGPARSTSPPGDPAPTPASHPPPTVWLGGMADPVVERAASRGLSLLLPPTLRVDQVARIAERAHAIAAESGVEPGRIGVLRDLWVTTGRASEGAAYLDRLAATYREYGSWWVLGGRHRGLDRPDLLDKQVERARGTAVVGPAAEVAEALGALEEAGADLVVAHAHRDWTRGPELDAAAERLASEVLPALERGHA